MPSFGKFRQWVDIGERQRKEPPLMWYSYDDAPLTVAEACDLAYMNKLVLMHRHEEDRVIARVWIPSKQVLAHVSSSKFSEDQNAVANY